MDGHIGIRNESADGHASAVIGNLPEMERVDIHEAVGDLDLQFHQIDEVRSSRDGHRAGLREQLGGLGR